MVKARLDVPDLDLLGGYCTWTVQGQYPGNRGPQNGSGVIGKKMIRIQS